MFVYTYKRSKEKGTGLKKSVGDEIDYSKISGTPMDGQGKFVRTVRLGAGVQNDTTDSLSTPINKGSSKRKDSLLIDPHCLT